MKQQKHSIHRNLTVSFSFLLFLLSLVSRLMRPLMFVTCQEEVGTAACPWYKGPTLMKAFDELRIGGRHPDGPLRIPVLDRYSERGVVSSF